MLQDKFSCKIFVEKLLQNSEGKSKPNIKSSVYPRLYSVCGSPEELRITAPEHLPVPHGGTRRTMYNSSTALGLKPLSNVRHVCGLFFPLHFNKLKFLIFCLRVCVCARARKNHNTCAKKARELVVVGSLLLPCGLQIPHSRWFSA